MAKDPPSGAPCKGAVANADQSTPNADQSTSNEGHSTTDQPQPASTSVAKPTIDNIISSIASEQATGLLTPITQQAAEALLEQAISAQKEGRVSDPTLAAGYKAFSRLAEKGKTISDTAHLLAAGDWARIILGCINYRVGDVVGLYKPFLVAKFKAHGVPGNLLNKLSDKHSAWGEITQERANQRLCAKLDEELLLLRKWRDDGKFPSEKPFTPYFERVDFLCKTKEIDPVIYLKVVRRYNERNSTAHSSLPELTEFLHEGWQTAESAKDAVDWFSMRDALLSEQDKVQTSANAGQMSPAHKQEILDLIKLYWGRFCDGASWSGEINLTSHAIARFSKKTTTVGDSAEPEQAKTAKVDVRKILGEELTVNLSPASIVKLTRDAKKYAKLDERAKQEHANEPAHLANQAEHANELAQPANQEEHANELAQLVNQENNVETQGDGEDKEDGEETCNDEVKAQKACQEGAIDEDAVLRGIFEEGKWYYDL